MGFMTENKRFSLNKDTEWWFVKDNTIQVNKYGYRDDLTCEDEYRGLCQELTEQETVDLLNELNDENKKLKQDLKELSDENEHYKSIFFELVETALKDENCRELYCKGILDIFNKANSLNQAREMIKEHLK